MQGSTGDAFDSLRVVGFVEDLAVVNSILQNNAPISADAIYSLRKILEKALYTSVSVHV